MRTSWTILAHAAALAATSLPVATVACNGHGGHSHSRSDANGSDERMCSHDTDDTTYSLSALSSSYNTHNDHQVNGLAGDVNGRRAEANFRVGERDFGTWQEFAANPTHRCATIPPAEEQMKELPEILVRWEERMAGPANRWRRLQEETVVVPVYFHILLNTEGTEGFVSDDTITEQLDVLDASFAPYFSFRLEGSTENQNTAWFTATPRSSEETEMKTALRQGGNEALNLYTSDIDGESLGWAIFPIAGTGSPGAPVPVEDGVVVRFDSLPGGNLFPFNEGDTAVHETGHWLGLLHTFDGESCDGPGDDIADTPHESEPAYGCPTERDVRTVLLLLLYCTLQLVVVYLLCC
jgi:hypothetical protein